MEDRGETFKRYQESVGRNCNLLVGMAIDSRGLCPQADAAALRGLGDLVSKAFGTPLAEYEGDLHLNRYSLSVPSGKSARYLVVMEDISQGERVLSFSLDCGISGHCIGHKRIIELPEGTTEVTFTIEESKDCPSLRGLWLY